MAGALSATFHYRSADLIPIKMHGQNLNVKLRSDGDPIQPSFRDYTE